MVYFISSQDQIPLPNIALCSFQSAPRYCIIFDKLCNANCKLISRDQRNDRHGDIDHRRIASRPSQVSYQGADAELGPTSAWSKRYTAQRWIDSIIQVIARDTPTPAENVSEPRWLQGARS
jgi:hypothetical protein